MNRRRHRGVGDRGRRDPRTVLEPDHPFVDEHRQELLDEERISLRGSHDPLADLVVEVCHAEEVLGDRGRVLLRQAVELDAARAGARRPLREALDELVPSRADEEERGVGRSGDDLLDEIEERRFGPMDVVEEDEKRAFRREALEELSRPPDELRDGIRGRRQPHRGLEPRPDVVVRDELGQLRRRDLDRVELADPRRRAHCLGERPERDSVAVRQAAAPQNRHALARGGDELVHET